MEPIADGSGLSGHFACDPLLSRRTFLRGAGAVSLAVPLAMLPLGCGQAQNRGAVPQGTPAVRALLLENRPKVELTATEAPIVRAGSGQAIRLALAGGSTAPITLTASGWQVGDIPFGDGELTVEPAVEGSVSTNGRAYRGRYRFVPKSGGRFDVVNDVDVDGYLMGVLARELFTNWHDEAYRAQAIVARTYALYVARTASTGSSFDVFADTRSQVYGGIASESSRAKRAVEATRGVVVAYGPPGEERIFKSYFSSCCGGITQSASAAFGDPDSVPLSEQNVGARCSISPRFAWASIVIPKSEVTRRLRIWGTNNKAPEQSIGDVARVEVLTANRYGRPASFAITDKRGYRYRMGCEDMRLAINTDATDGVRLPSSFCRPIDEPGMIRFADGHGLGHGVGMCQWCAQVQATSGVPHEQIVAQAFPQAVLVRAY